MMGSSAARSRAQDVGHHVVRRRDADLAGVVHDVEVGRPGQLAPQVLRADLGDVAGSRLVHGHADQTAQLEEQPGRHVGVCQHGQALGDQFPQTAGRRSGSSACPSPPSASRGGCGRAGGIRFWEVHVDQLGQVAVDLGLGGRHPLGRCLAAEDLRRRLAGEPLAAGVAVGVDLAGEHLPVADDDVHDGAGAVVPFHVAGLDPKLRGCGLGLRFGFARRLRRLCRRVDGGVDVAIGHQRQPVRLRRPLAVVVLAERLHVVGRRAAGHGRRHSRP